ncbi:MAG TPA: YggT family protein [Chloroflexia bacterium]|nr:YggT family protein [Chloroflexia bacterium]
MDASMNPNRRRVVREQQETVYEPIQPVQPVYEQPVVPVQPVQPVYEQPVVPVQPVYEQPVVPVEPAPYANNTRSYSQMGDMRVENVRQGYYDADGNLVEREEQVFDDPYTRRLNVLDRVTRIVYFVMGLLEVLLALRFLFRVIDAGTANGFVNFIYNLTAPFVAPFNGIFNDQAITRGSVVEFSTLIAMAIYALLTYGIIQLLNLLLTPSRSSREVYSTTRRRRY